MIKNFPLFFCTGFGVGFFPFIPGTFASLMILPLIWFIKVNFTLEILIFSITIYYCLSILFLRMTLLNKSEKDPKYVVCDEYIGQSIALIFCEEKIIDYFLSFFFLGFLILANPFQ